MVEEADDRVTFKGKGECEGQSTVSARVVLAFYNLRDRNPALKATDERIVQRLREHAGLLWQPAGGAAASRVG